nr:hypothetical protein BaRGS_001509 [Batillaria attramentaria]
MLDANKEAKRLSSQINARMDIQGPQREFEKAEQRIDKTKRESKAKYEREQRQLGKQLEALGVNKHHRSSTLSVQDTLFPDQSTELPKDKTEEQCNQYRGHSDSRKVSTESQSDSRKSSKADRGPSSSGQAMGQEPSMAISTDIPLTSGPAISLMLMVKALAGSEAGSKLDERAIKILKSIMDESRNAVKTIK